MTRTHRTHEAGQALVIMAIAIVAVIAGVGLIIDGGNAWAQQRISQNGNDASAEAGAVVLANYLSNAVVPPSGWDGAVDAAVLDAADRNGIDVETAYYTDICGTLLRARRHQGRGPGGRRRGRRRHPANQQPHEPRLPERRRRPRGRACR